MVIGGGGQDSAPPGCDPTKDPKDSPKCVDDSFGVFVSASAANDTGDGTKAHPVQKIATALGKANATKSRVYICEGTYAEHVAITSAVSLYAGFSCADWSYTGTKAKVSPTDAGYALSVANVASAVAIEDLAFTSLPGTAAAPSSITAFVSGSPSVTLRRALLTAGAGFKGKDASGAVTGTPTPADLNGNVGVGNAEGAAKSCTCSSGGTSKGAKGGTGGAAPTGGDNGETAIAPPSPPTATGAGGTVIDCTNGTASAKPGSAAPAAASASSPATVGTLDTAGWTPTAGATAPSGIPGQGGGGGGGQTVGAGGGGGCGGCGGGGGAGGAGGGASIALVAVSAPVNLVACQLASANAGSGGIGTAGAAGQNGGLHGTSVSACNGGNGGNGGAGGAGAGGSGGVSIGVLYKGATPVLDTPTQGAITTGTLGTAGAGGIAGTNDGKSGVAAPVKDVATL
jgi:hypothetical protein